MMKPNCDGRDDMYPEDWHTTGRIKAKAWATAIAVCDRDGPNECPLIDRCLKDAMEAERGASVIYRWGVFAGLTPQKRAELDRFWPYEERAS